MNYLAHLLLADDTDASRVGNLLGDFTRGTIADLAERYPPEVVRGIRMHRAVDRFTDSHPLFREARGLLAPGRRRFAGIIVDIFFDHFLCVHWRDYCALPLEEFIASVYKALEDHPGWRAGRLADAFPRMRDEDWLARYATLEGIDDTLRRVSRRSPRVGAIAGGAEDLRDNYAAYESLFRSFMPELLQFVDAWKKEQ